MALCGIGGNTVHEVENSLTTAEIKQWQAYRERRGSINVGRRIEQAIGNAMAIYLNSKVKKKDHIHPADLMPFEDKPEESIEEALRRMTEK